MFCAVKYGVEITHNFLETGHTQNEGDSMHSVIERASKNIPVFSPDQWYNIARIACKKKPYSVKEIYAEDIFDLKKLLNETTKNWKKDQNGNNVMWTKVGVINVEPENPYLIKIQFKYDGEIYIVDTAEKKRGGSFVDLKEYDLKTLRNGPVPISQAKFNDLMQLCKERVIPEIYHPFYKNLQNAASADDINGQEMDSD